jgi:hypothetical protein
MPIVPVERKAIQIFYLNPETESLDVHPNPEARRRNFPPKSLHQD